MCETSAGLDPDDHTKRQVVLVHHSSTESLLQSLRIKNDESSKSTRLHIKIGKKKD